MPISATLAGRMISPLRNAIHTKNAETIGKATWWFGGLIAIPVAALNPILMNHQYKKNGVPAQQRRSLVMQEASNQAVNTVVHLTSYFGLSLLVSKMMQRGVPQELKNLRKLGPQLKELTGAEFKDLIPRLKELTGKELEDLGPKLEELTGIGFKDLVPKLEKLKQQQGYISAMRVLIANIGGFFGQGVLRPLLGSTVLMKWQKNQKTGAPGAAGGASQGQGQPNTKADSKTDPKLASSPAAPAPAQPPALQRPPSLPVTPPAPAFPPPPALPAIQPLNPAMTPPPFPTTPSPPPMPLPPASVAPAATGFMPNPFMAPQPAAF